MEEHLVVSAPPHLKKRISTSGAMWDVIIALVPAVILSIYFFGLNALVVISSGIAFAVLSQWVAGRLLGRSHSLRDGSAVVTGLLLALTLPPSSPWWIVAIGSLVAIVVAKELFGGIGHNIFNPALVGRAFLIASWGAHMTTWIKPFWWKAVSFGDLLQINLTGREIKFVTLAGRTLDAVTGATPLALVKQGVEAGKVLPSYVSLFWGSVGGSLGETSALALLLGGLYLVYRGHITWHVPVSYIGTVVVLSAVLGQDPLYHMLAGGLFLGAFFMATDWVTTPITDRGRLIFGLGAGILTVLIRKFGGYPEGVCYSILLMNGATPLIDRYVKQRKLGEVKSK